MPLAEIASVRSRESGRIGGEWSPMVTECVVSQDDLLEPFLWRCPTG